MKKIITLFLILFCLNSFGQINYFFWAHSSGTIYYSAAIYANYTRNDCSFGDHGTDVLVNFSSGAYTSYTSQADANSQATAGAQLYANANGSCEADITYYYNTYQSCSASRNNCGAGYSSPESYNGYVDADAYASEISIADANATAQAYCQSDIQAYANANGSCVPDECTRPGGLTSATLVPVNDCGVACEICTGSTAQSTWGDGDDIYDGTGSDCTPFADGYYVTYNGSWVWYQVTGGKIYMCYM